MDAADVVFTKPGGITSTEAIVKNIPLIHTHPIPGLENHNAHFFHQHGMSYFTSDIQQQVAVAKRLCEDSHYRKQMLRNQRMIANPHSSNDVINLILENRIHLREPITNDETN
jgi:processive 1,2-diacylglycerol beta-glucosyltransferase